MSERLLHRHRATSRQIAYIDLSLIFTSIPFAVILFDETCVSEPGDTGIVSCVPAIQNGLLLASVVALLAAFVISKTMFFFKNFHLFERSKTEQPFLANMVQTFGLVMLVWSAVNGYSALLALSLVLVLIGDIWGILTGGPAFELAKEGGHEFWVLVIGLVSGLFWIAAFLLVFNEIEGGSNFAGKLAPNSATIPLLAAYLLASSLVRNDYCRRVYFSSQGEGAEL